MDDVTRTTPYRLTAQAATGAVLLGAVAGSPLPGLLRGALVGLLVGLVLRGALRGAADARHEALAASVRHAHELSAVTRLTLHDALTGLPNRVLLLDRLRHALSGAGRRSKDVGLLFLDLDGFKAVNDSYGHAAGDQVLSIVASRLRATVRTGDTAARLAGDEFVIVCDEVDGADGLRRAARRIEAALVAPMVVDGRTICLGSSIGAVLHDRDGDGAPGQAADRMLARADEAMYQVKRDRHLRLAEMGVLNRLAADAARLLAV